MPLIKIYLEVEEYAPVARLAEQLHLKPQDVAYSGLNRLMLAATKEELRNDILNTKLCGKIIFRVGAIRRAGVGS